MTAPTMVPPTATNTNIPRRRRDKPTQEASSFPSTHLSSSEPSQQQHHHQQQHHRSPSSSSDTHRDSNQTSFASSSSTAIAAASATDASSPSPHMQQQQQQYTGCANITGYRAKQHHGHKFVVYNISIIIPQLDLQWALNKRFSEFLQFHKMLRKDQRSLLPKLPSKTLFHKNLSVIESRKAAFQVYLNALLENKELLQDERVREFLSMPQNMHETSMRLSMDLEENGMLRMPRSAGTVHGSQAEAYNSSSQEDDTGMDAKHTRRRQQQQKYDLLSLPQQQKQHEEEYYQNSSSQSNYTDDDDEEDSHGINSGAKRRKRRAPRPRSSAPQYQHTNTDHAASRRAKSMVQTNKLQESASTSSLPSIYHHDSKGSLTSLIHVEVQYVDIPCTVSKIVTDSSVAGDSEKDFLSSLTEDDLILVYEQDDDWSLVKSRGKLSFIPTGILQAPSSPRHQLRTGFLDNSREHVSQARRRTRTSSIMSNLTSILYDYYPLQEDELQLSRGDLVRVVREDKDTDRYQVSVIERAANISQMEPKMGWIPCDYLEKPRLVASAS